MGFLFWKKKKTDELNAELPLRVNTGDVVKTEEMQKLALLQLRDRRQNLDSILDEIRAIKEEARGITMELEVPDLDKEVPDGSEA